jgi:hypothetical protein
MCTRYILVYMVDSGDRRSSKPTGIGTAGRCTGRRATHGPLVPVAFPGEPVFFAVEQVADLWSVSAMSIYRQVHEGSLPAIRVGDPDKGRLVIPAQAVDPDRLVGAPPARAYYRLGAAARFFGVSYGHLHREVQARRFPAVRVRSIWLVPTPAIDAMIHAALDLGGLVHARDFGDWHVRSVRTAEDTHPALDTHSTTQTVSFPPRNRPAVS